MQHPLTLARTARVALRWRPSTLTYHYLYSRWSDNAESTESNTSTAALSVKLPVIYSQLLLSATDLIEKEKRLGVEAHFLITLPTPVSRIA